MRAHASIMYIRTYVRYATPKFDTFLNETQYSSLCAKLYTYTDDGGVDAVETTNDV